MDSKDIFDQFQKKVEEEDEKYKNFRINGENYNFPHIYLTDEEINDFNEECKRCGIDLKVVPLSDYMNFNLAENEEVDIESNMKIVNNCYIEKKEVEEDEKSNEEEIIRNHSTTCAKIDYNTSFIGKKRNIVEDDETEKSNDKNSQTDEKSNNSVKSSINFNRNKLDDDIPINKNNKKNKKGQKKKNPKQKGKKEKIKKKNISKNVNINDKFNNYFKKIKETSLKYQNEDNEKKQLIDEISKKSKNLTLEELKNIADSQHIRIIGDELNIYQLEKLNSNQLENLLTNIVLNSNFGKLDPHRKDNIKKIRNKEEWEKKSKERSMKKKKEKNQSVIDTSIKIDKDKDNDKDQSKENKVDDDESESESSYDENDSLN